jgi:hypothetical protein
MNGLRITEAIMLDLVFLLLGAALFVGLALYARSLGRL